MSRGNFGRAFPIRGSTNASSRLVNGGASVDGERLDVRSACRHAACDIGACEYGVTP
jgi:hypothetical protein